jgi:uncharacterized protein YbjT (DUF2867 family)
MKTALVAGATGLVGKQLVQELLHSNRYKTVKVLTRRDIDLAHPKLIVYNIDLNKLEAYDEALRADDVFCCLGTTMAKARSKEEFYRVDYTYPVSLARRCSQLGAKQFLIVSALGANKRSRFYYNRVKGEVEETVSSVSFRCIHIFRPSLLLGKRNETRQGEDAAKLFYKIFGFLIPARYKGVEALQVARAMATFAAEENGGIFIHESNEIRAF